MVRESSSFFILQDARLRLAGGRVAHIPGTADNFVSQGESEEEVKEEAGPGEREHGSCWGVRDHLNTDSASTLDLALSLSCAVRTSRIRVPLC